MREESVSVLTGVGCGAAVVERTGLGVVVVVVRRYFLRGLTVVVLSALITGAD